MKNLIVIAGPTAIGKTATAIALAQHYHTEILSADSRQFYREMAIGTAKPSFDEQAAAKHYFIDSHSISEPFNVGDFEREGLQVLNNIFREHQVAIMAGGSGLYIKAICEGFDELPQIEAAIRENLNKLYQEKGLLSLQERLKTTDPDYYNQVDLNNPQRLIRALEVTESTGKPFSAYRTGIQRQRPFNIIKIGLDMPRGELYQRINHRVDAMATQGLIDEVNSLLPHRQLNALNTVGYSEIFDYIDGKTNLPTAIELVKQNTRRFAKRQLTWFRKDNAIQWFLPTNVHGIIHYIDAVMAKQPAS